MEIFSKVSEKDVTRAIVSEFAAEFLEYIESEVIIIGAGPSGLIAARRLAENGVKTGVLSNKPDEFLAIAVFREVGRLRRTLTKPRARGRPEHVHRHQGFHGFEQDVGAADVSCTPLS